MSITFSLSWLQTVCKGIRNSVRKSLKTKALTNLYKFCIYRTFLLNKLFLVQPENCTIQNQLLMMWLFAIGPDMLVIVWFLGCTVVGCTFGLAKAAETQRQRFIPPWEDEQNPKSKVVVPRIFTSANKSGHILEIRGWTAKETARSLLARYRPPVY